MLAWILELFGFNGHDRRTNRKMPTQEELDRSLDDFLNRPIHKILTKEIIEKTKDQDLEQQIVDNLSAILEEFDENDENSPDKLLTNGQASIYSTWMVEAEVNNGGFNQFYFNTSEELGKWAEEGFETIGAIQFAKLMREANDIYIKIKDDLVKFNDGTAEGFSESYKGNPLNELDERFYKLYKEEPLNQLRIKYIREHLTEFVTP